MLLSRLGIRSRLRTPGSAAQVDSTPNRLAYVEQWNYVEINQTSEQ